MGRKCPPGVFCIENVTFLFLFFIICLGMFVYFQFDKTKNNSTNHNHVDHKYNFLPTFSGFNFNIPHNTLTNPLTPPLKNNFYFKDSSDPRGVPINIQTRGFHSSYTQVGILTRNDKNDTILPLMGKPLYSNRSKWQYYTINDKNNFVKLPISKNGRSCTSQYGCDDLMNGDNVFVEGYNDSFNVTIYENESPRYIPYV
jgi:hypothetical protein